VTKLKWCSFYVQTIKIHVGGSQNFYGFFLFAVETGVRMYIPCISELVVPNILRVNLEGDTLQKWKTKHGKYKTWEYNSICIAQKECSLESKQTTQMVQSTFGLKNIPALEILYNKIYNNPCFW